MAQEKSTQDALCCPVCWAIGKYKKSKVARHVRAVRREILLTVRKVLDARIEQLTEDKPEPAKKVEVK